MSDQSIASFVLLWFTLFNEQLDLERAAFEANRLIQVFGLLAKYSQTL